MLLTVTQEHIDMGTTGDASGCPLALSIRDYLGEPDALVLVDGGGTVLIGPEDTGTEWQLSLRAELFMLRFDNGQTVEPGQFQLI